VQHTAQGTQLVSSNVSDVQRGATETGSASSQVLSAAQTLSSDSNRLRLEVDKFLHAVRAAWRVRTYRRRSLSVLAESRAGRSRGSEGQCS